MNLVAIMNIPSNGGWVVETTAYCVILCIALVQATYVYLNKRYLDTHGLVHSQDYNWC